MHGEQYPGIALRPYQALCLVCSLGEETSESQCGKLKEVLEKVKASPEIPITLKSNVGDVFVYQDPGTEEDSPGSSEFNMKRDLEILQKLNIPPGTTLPARILFNRILERIATISEICGFEALTSEAWQGCPKAKAGFYRRALEMGISSIIPPKYNSCTLRSATGRQNLTQDQPHSKAYPKRDRQIIKPHNFLYQHGY